jgi:ABC-2 type transport system permease protein
MAARALVRRALGQERTRSLAFAGFFAFIAIANSIGYAKAYPTVTDRIAFARSFGANKAVELFYGVPHDLLSVGGYSAWRVGGTVSIVAGVWALLVAVKALRGEEDAGRTELVLALPVSRRTALAAPAVALGLVALGLGLTLFAGLVIGGVGAGDAAEIALASMAPVPVFAGVGAVASQLAESRRLALVLGFAVVAAAFLARIVADTAVGLGWLRWTTPFGWSEELRAAAGLDARVLVLPLVTGTLLLVLAAVLAVRRDVGSGLLRGRDSTAPRSHLMSSPAALALRDERMSFAGNALMIGVFAVVVGVLSTSFDDANMPERFRKAVERLGVSITTPAGAIGLYFSSFVLAISLFAVQQVGAARREEADGRLETLLARPLSRSRWLGGRLAVAALGAVGLAVVAGVAAWAGAASKQAGISLVRLLEAGLNTLPASLLFLGLAALVYAAWPRASTGISYGVVGLAFLWQLVGGLLRAPGWLLDVTPFRHVALVPAQPFRAGAAVVMLVAGCIAAGGALVLFRRRDLTS